MSELPSENSLHADTILAKNPDILTSPVQDGLAMMSIESGNYFGLDDIGMKVWDAIDSKRSLGEICAELVSEHDVSTAQCLSDIRSLGIKLLHRELVTIVETSP